MAALSDSAPDLRQGNYCGRFANGTCRTIWPTRATAKSENIREAVDATAGNLSVDVERVVPVCLVEGKLYTSRKD